MLINSARGVPRVWVCPCCKDRGPWLDRWHSDLGYGSCHGTRLACSACGERELSEARPAHFTAIWGHEWAAVAWMASAEYEGFRALSDEIEMSCEGGACPTRKTFREWIDEYTRGLDPIWP